MSQWPWFDFLIAFFVKFDASFACCGILAFPRVRGTFGLVECIIRKVGNRQTEFAINLISGGANCTPQARSACVGLSPKRNDFTLRCRGRGGVEMVIERQLQFKAAVARRG